METHWRKEGGESHEQTDKGEWTPEGNTLGFPGNFSLGEDWAFTYSKGNAWIPLLP